MCRRFAQMSYIENKEDIAYKFNLLKKAPEQMKDWYVQKFNPYTLERISLCEEEGFAIKLPFTQNEAREKEDLALSCINRTIETLEEYKVSIAVYPKNFPYEGEGRIVSADGLNLMPFFIESITGKLIKRKGLKLKNTEFLVICSEPDLAVTVINNLYPNINFLSVMFTENYEEYKEVFEEKSKEIYGETGLNISITGFNKNILSNADIIINTAKETQWDYCYKRGAVYIDISGDRQREKELSYRREDIMTVSSFRIKTAEGEIYPANIFEMPFYVKCRAYRQLVRRGFDERLAEDVKRYINKLELIPLLNNH